MRVATDGYPPMMASRSSRLTGKGAHSTLRNMTGRIWEPACSRKRSVSHMNTGCDAAFAGKPAPTGLVSLVGNSSEFDIAPRPGDGPDDQSQHRQQRDQQYPEDFHPGLGATFEYVDDGPDVQDKNDQGNQAVERGTHGDAPEE